MALNLGTPWLYRIPHPPPHFSKFTSYSSAAFHNKKDFLLFLLLGNNFYSSSQSNNQSFHPSLNSAFSTCVGAKSSANGSGNCVEEEEDSALDDELVNRVSSSKDASEVLEMVAEKSNRNGGVLSSSDCCRIISAALERHNSDLALSIFNAMRSSFDQDFTENGTYVERWKWSRPDVSTFSSLVLGLAASLRVSEALNVIASICQVGVSPGEEVPFGKIVRCPACMIAVAVAQPQHGVQIVSCSQCRYKYELVSGDVTSIQSEEISMDVPAWKRGLRFLQIVKQNIPAAIHSIVVQTPSGVARTHRFATETVDLPAQDGERVTIALAASSNVYREVGPFKFSLKSPQYYPGEPICLTNHRDGRESLLLRAPTKNRNIDLGNPSILLPVLTLLAAGDAASGIIDPSLPQLVSVLTLGSFALGATFNAIILPQLSQLPQRLVDTIAIKQQLLAQYDTLQTRIRELKEAAENEVWMFARMCQLENKIFAVGEPSYRARRSRVRKVREGLENSLKGRIEIIDSYARISSMIEIEVEMDTDVPAAEAASNAESIGKQIEQIMELENLEERWRLQVEANDEVERLLNTEPLSSDQI